MGLFIIYDRNDYCSKSKVKVIQLKKKKVRVYFNGFVYINISFMFKFIVEIVGIL